MKTKIIYLLFAMSFVFTQAQSSDGNGSTVKEINIEWQENFNTATKKAKSEKKPILIYFTGSDWCGPCKKLDKELFSTEKFKKFSDTNLVLYKANFPYNMDLVSAKKRITNTKLSERYNQSSFPTIIVINEQGEVLGRKNGSYLADIYYPFLKEACAK